MSWKEQRRNLLRKELAGLESELALCNRCYGDSDRFVLRFDRSSGLPRVLVLISAPPDSLLKAGERWSLESPDPSTRALRELLERAGFTPEEVLLGATRMCRPINEQLAKVVPLDVCQKACASHVRELVRLVGPRLIVCVGAAALDSLQDAFPESAVVAALRFPQSVGVLTDAGGTSVCVLVDRRGAHGPNARRQREESWMSLGRVWDAMRGEEVAREVSAGRGNEAMRKRPGAPDAKPPPNPISAPGGKPAPQPHGGGTPVGRPPPIAMASPTKS